MKVVLLAGGYGTRLSEETQTIPKGMVEIGGQPILWHIMKIYSAHGFNEFIVCCGYKSYVIKEYFANFDLHRSDVTFDFSKGSVITHSKRTEPWKVTLVDTGLDTMTGGRIKRVAPFIEEDNFLLTYGDGVSDVNIKALVETHNKSGKLATVTAVRPPGRFGAMKINGNSVNTFIEKPDGDGDYINGGFFVVNRKVFDLIDNDTTVWEQKPLQSLAHDHQLNAFMHNGFWFAMDHLRDKNQLEKLWASGSAPWKIWS